MPRPKHARERIATSRHKRRHVWKMHQLEDRCLLAVMAPVLKNMPDISASAPYAAPQAGLWDSFTLTNGDEELAQLQINNRWTTTAVGGGGLGQGDPTTLTWSIADDNTMIPGFNGEPAAGSDLIAKLDTWRGAGPGGSDLTQRPWFDLFSRSFARMSAVSGLTYVYEPNDDGIAYSNVASNAPGIPGVRGDIRVGGHFIDGQDGSNTLAYNFYPNVGDMVIDTSNSSFYASTANDSLALRNVVMHENGHGVGIAHVESTDAGFLMEPFINTAFDGPQLDDVLALQRSYGDALEKIGGNTSATAIDLGTVGLGQTVRRGTLGNSTIVAAAQTDFVSIDDEADVDFYKFTITAGAAVTLALTPRGVTYQQGPQGGTQTAFTAASQSDLSLQLLGTNGTTVLQSANTTGLGGSEAITGFTISTPGTYFVRISGATADRIQLYGLDVTVGTPSTQAADLSLGMSVNNATPGVGQNVTFTLTVSNSGPDNANSVAVRDQIPAGLAFVSATPSQGSYASGTGIWTVGTIASGGSATLQLTATVATQGVKVNSAEVSAAGQIDPDSVPNNGSTTEDDDAQVTVTPQGGVVTVERRVAASSDDAEQSAAGAVSTGSSDLELVVDGTSVQTVGLRFSSLALPAGAIINRAYVQFETDEVKTAATSLTIRGQAADNALTFTTASNNISSRPTTAASVPWSPAAWNVVGEAGVNQQTSDLKTIIQEIVNRPGWISGNALALVVTGSGVRTARAFDTAAADAPLLHVEYFVPDPNDVGDTLATARAYTLGGADQSNLIGNGAFATLDVDLYRFTATAGSQLTARTYLASGTAMDTYMRLFNASGVELASNDDITLNVDLYSQIQNFTLPTTGNYYVGVSGYNNSNYNPAVGGSGVSGSTGDYALSIQVQAPSLPEIDVRGNAISIPDGDLAPSPSDGTDFGGADVTTGLATRTFTIANTGSAALNLSGTPRVTLTGSSAFTVTLQPASPIAAAGSTAFEISFDPAAAGAATATVSIANDDGDENPYNFTITGTGTVPAAPEIDVRGNAISIPDGDITAGASDGTDFGSADVTTGVVTRTFTIANTGSAALNLGGSPRVTLSGSSAFTVTVQPASPIAAAGTTTFQISFDPAAAGAVSAAVSIINDDGDENPYDFSITGTGTVSSGTTTVERRIAAGSDDAEQGSGGSVSLTSSDLELVVDGSATQTVGLRFSALAIPTGATISKAYVQFETDEVKTGATSLTIRGQAADNPLTFTTASNNVSSRPATAASVAWSPAAWNTIGEAGANQQTPDLKAIVQEIVNRPGWASGNALALVITGTGVRTARAFEAAAADAPLLHVEYTIGPALPPEIDLRGNSISIPSGQTATSAGDGTDFGSANVAGGVVTRSFTVANTGGGPLNLSGGPRVALAGSTAFTVIAQPGSPVAAAGATTFQISFDPSLEGAVTATVSIVSNDSDENPYTFIVGGTGTVVIAPEIDVRGNNISIPDGSITPATGDGTNFGNADVTSGLVTRTFTIANTGNTTLNLSGSPQVTVSGSTAFAVVAQPAAAVLAATSTTFQISFDPSVVGAATAVVNITNDDSDENPYTFTITGTGTSSSGVVIIDRRIAAGNDDVEQGAGGAVALTSSDLELVVDGGFAQTVGLRFTGLAIPAGAVISKAYVQFETDEAKSAATNLVIRGQAADNATAFGTALNNVSSRPMTAASASWSPAAWNTVGEAGANQQTTDLAAVIQEIVSRPGWASGNALALMLTGSGVRTARAFETNPNDAPLLHVEFTVPASATSVARSAASTARPESTARTLIPAASTQLPTVRQTPAAESTALSSQQALTASATRRRPTAEASTAARAIRSLDEVYRQLGRS